MPALQPDPINTYLCDGILGLILCHCPHHNHSEESEAAGLLSDLAYVFCLLQDAGSGTGLVSGSAEVRSIRQGRKEDESL